MTKQQERLVHNIKKIILVASLALMLLVTVVVFFQPRPSGLSHLRPNPYKPEDFVIFTPIEITRNSYKVWFA